MSFGNWKPLREIDELASEINELLMTTPLSIINRYATPRTDVYQTEKEVIVTSEIPGLSKEDMEVLIENTYIRLSGHKKRNTGGNEEICRSERFFGSFSRIIPLPSEVEPDKAVAQYKDGILTIVMPKSENKSPNGKKVEIQ
ncbi:MAG TPA: heat-shock protein Hsp20 [Ruminiclostridium sp.]|jgi:HSP20 family protein|nr:Hsp20/alpha crystallin family protein [Clostridiaceae bacterium]HAA24509.1 heat-shock protein Hsp20 [Ruminiclostridium sp.]